MFKSCNGRMLLTRHKIEQKNIFKRHCEKFIFYTHLVQALSRFSHNYKYLPVLLSIDTPN